MMEKYIQVRKGYALSNYPSCTDGESVFGMLYECYNENNPYDNEQIKADFNTLYAAMNSKTSGKWTRLPTQSVLCAGIMSGLGSWKG